MSRIVTKEEFQDAVDEELAWRKKELKVFKDMVPNDSSPKQKALLRCSIPIFYAHWEGFVKKSCTYYLEYVSNKREKFCNLKPQFITLALTKHLGEIEIKKIEDKTRLIQFIIGNLNSTSNLHFNNAIHTKSNLRYDVFKDICFLLDINISTFSKQEVLINDLVDTRNTIAHGEGHKVTYKQFEDFYNDVLILLETLRTELENAAALDKHKI